MLERWRSELAADELMELLRDVEIEWRTNWELHDPIRTLYYDALKANPDLVLRALVTDIFPAVDLEA